MNYNKIYDNIINRAKERGSMNVYTEKHHIIPRCMGGNDDKTNLAVLTPEEHFVCHLLLLKIYPDNNKLAYAIYAMRMNKNKRKLNNRTYGWVRRRCSLLCRSIGPRPKARGPRVDRIVGSCLTCKKEYETVPSMRHKKYCSMDCAGSGKKEKTIKYCSCCKKRFVVNPCHVALKYCSRACSYKGMEKQKIIKTCPTCNTTFSVVPHKHMQRYCSKLCV